MPPPALYRLPPPAQLCLLPPTGHGLPGARPEWFSAIVLDFLARWAALAGWPLQDPPLSAPRGPAASQPVPSSSSIPPPGAKPALTLDERLACHWPRFAD